MDNYETLLKLRNITKISLIDNLRIKRAIAKAERVREMLSKSDPTHCYSTDYTEVINLELRMRLNVLKYSLYDEWKKYISIERDGYTLEEYTRRFIKEYVNDDKSKTLK